MENKMENFDEMDFVLKFIFIKVVKEENLNPMNFYINEHNLSHFLKEFGQLHPTYVHDIFIRFSKEQ